MKNRITAILLALGLLLCALPAAAFAAGNSYVELRPASFTVSSMTGCKVGVGDYVSGYRVSSVSGYTIRLDLGRYNVSNESFRLPYATDLWTFSGAAPKVDYISVAANSSGNRSEGSSILLANGGSSAVYYFKQTSYKTFTLQYDANGGSGAPAAQKYTATGKYEYSHTFTISQTAPTRSGHVFLGWSTDPNAETASYFGGGSIYVSGTTTLYAVWQAEQPQPDVVELRIEKTFAGIYAEQIPDEFYMTYTAGVNRDGFRSVSGTLCRSDAEQTIVSGVPTLAWTIKVPVLRDNAAQTNVSLAEYNAAVAGYTLVSSGLSFALDSKFTGGTRTVTNAYTPAPPAISDLLTGDGVVEIQCVNAQAAHAAIRYALLAGSYEAGVVTPDGSGGWYCDVVVGADDYIAAYNAAVKLPHTANDGEQSKRIRLRFENGIWRAETALPIVFQVKCETPTYKVTYTDGVEGEEIFTDQVYNNLLAGTPTPAFVGTPVRDGYVFAGWNPELAKTVSADATYTAVWKVDSNGNGQPDDEEQRYSVTYTDGVEGEEIFADQVYDGLLAGTPTPAFVGTPVRDGYVFAGWNPEVAKTVSADATYTAVWKVDSNGNGQPDDEEQRYSVTYTDGVEGEEIFADQVYDGLLAGTPTPAFDGTPVREGFTFKGWKPDVAETVTATVLYTAQWEKAVVDESSGSESSDEASSDESLPDESDGVSVDVSSADASSGHAADASSGVSDAPQTGDAGSLALWLVLAGSAGAGVWIYGRRRKL